VTNHRIIAWIVTATLLLAGLSRTAHAAFTDDFDALLAELQSRSVALSNSTDKAEQKQKKACDKAIAAINKSTTLARDIKTAGKVTKALTKVFTNEFAAAASMTLSAVTFSNSLDAIITQLFTDLQSDVQSELNELQTLISGLPDGADKTKALAALAAAQDAIDQAGSATDVKTLVKALTTALKNVLKGQKIASNAGGGGGGACGTITQSTVTMTASNDAFHASLPIPGFAGAEYTQSTMTFSVGGTDGSTGNAVAFTVDSGVNGTGTYTNVSGNYTIGSPPTQTFNITGGSMTINGLDLVGMTACGTGSFTATDGVNTINVSDFVFSINTLGVSP